MVGGASILHVCVNRLDSFMQSPSYDEPPSNVQVEYEPPSRLRTYWWRWWVLFVFVLNMVINNVTWITFAPVADIMRCYYGISNAVVNTLSMSSAILTLLLVLPAAWSLTHWGLRFTILLSSAATALGASLRVSHILPYTEGWVSLPLVN